MQRLGMTIGVNDTPLGSAVSLCREAEDAGYTDVWSAEAGALDGLAPLAAVAASTSSVRLGTAILPVFTRPPALMAMSAATLQNLSGGRFVLGLGTSSSIIVERWMGGSFERPLTRLREYLLTVRSILAGEKVAFEGKTVRIDGYRLQLEPVAPVPLYMAALGPAACRLAGELADGVIFFMKSPGGITQAMGWVAEGARAAGRDPSALDCVIRLPVALAEGERGDLSALARRFIVSYAIVDVYNRSLADQGFGAAASAIAERWAAGDRKGAVDEVPDDMVDELMIVGDAEECRGRLQRFRAAGVTTPVVLPFSLPGGPDELTERARATMLAVAPAAARPLRT